MTYDPMSAHKADRAKFAADMASMPHLDDGFWTWWAGPSAEAFYLSKATRAAVIDAATAEYEDGFHITRARHGELDLADVFDLEAFCDAVDDRFEDLQSEDHEWFMSIYSAEQLGNLETRIRQTIRTWQVEVREMHKVKCVPWTFTECDQQEFIPAAEVAE